MSQEKSVSKRGKQKNKERRVVLEPSRAHLYPLDEKDVEWAVDHPFHVFLLNPDDVPMPLYEAMPGVMGLACLNALSRGEMRIYTLGEAPITLRKQVRGVGWVSILHEEEDGVLPVLLARDLTQEQEAQLKLAAEAMEEDETNG